MTRPAARALAGRFRDLLAGLSTLPDRRAWLESAAWATVMAAVAGPLAWVAGLIGAGASWTEVSARTVLIPFVAPALLEECLFRGLLLPHPTRSGVPLRHRARWWAGSLTAYVAAHPLVAATVRPEAKAVFDTPPFLLEAALLGITSTALYERTGSLWPAVLLHGMVVGAWLSLGGAAQLGI